MKTKEVLPSIQEQEMDRLLARMTVYQLAEKETGKTLLGTAHFRRPCPSCGLSIKMNEAIACLGFANGEWVWVHLMTCAPEDPGLLEECLQTLVGA